MALRLAGIALAVQLVSTALGQKDVTGVCSESCDGPWRMTFNAEQAFHAFLADEPTAAEYHRLVLNKTTLTVLGRHWATREFLHDKNATGTALEKIYDLAVNVEKQERAAHFWAMCSVSGVSTCSGWMRQLQEIYDDLLQTHGEQCQQVERLLCQMPDAELARLRNQRAYRYRIERDVEPPTYEAAFRDTYALAVLNETLKTRALSLVERFENEYTLNGLELEAEMRKWAVAFDDTQLAVAALQWSVYKYFTVAKREHILEEVYRNRQCSLNDTVNCDENSREHTSPMCYHCDGPWMVPFSAEKFLIHYLPPVEKKNYEEEVLKKSPHVTWSERKEDTRRFLSSRAHPNAWLMQTYQNLSAVELFERNAHYANLSARFASSPYRDQLMEILDAAYNPNITFGRMCAQIKTAYCHIPLSQLNEAFPPYAAPPYDYNIVWDGVPPTFDSLLGTYTFRKLGDKAWSASDAFLDEYRYSMNDSEYIEWANRLHTAESQTLAIVHLGVYQYRYKTKADAYLQYGTKVADIPGERCCSCVGRPWSTPLNASSIIRVMVDDYDVEWKLRYVIEAAEITKERRYSAIRKLLAESFGSRNEIVNLYENVVELALFEQTKYYLDVMKRADPDAYELLWYLIDTARNEKLTDARSCRIIEQLLSEERPGRAELLRQPAYSPYVLAPGRPLPTFQHMWETYTFRAVASDSSKKPIFVQILSFGSQFAFPVLRDWYMRWAGDLSKDAKVLARLQWRVYELRLKRLDHENRKRLSRAGASHETLQAYAAMVDQFYNGDVTFAEARRTLQKIGTIGDVAITTTFPLYPDQ